MSSQISFHQSLKNHIYFNDQIKKELEISNEYLKVTHILVIDELYKRKLINLYYHKLKLKEYINISKKEELKDLCYSLVCSAFLMTIIFIFFLPSNKYYLFKICYFIYLFTAYYITFLFYKKLY